MGAHHDLNLTAPSPYKFKVLHESDRVDFDNAYGGRVEVTFTNSLGVNVYVADRQGGMLTVRPVVGSVSVFGIRLTRTFNKGTQALFRSPALTPSRGGARPSESDYGLRENYEVRDNTVGRLDKTKDLRVGITHGELINQGGVVYHEESDLVISLTPEQAIHMGSPIEVLRRMSAGIMHASTDGLSGWSEFSIRIVVNTGRSRDRFINLAGMIHRIRPVKSPTCKDGIYVYRNGHCNENQIELQAGVEFFEYTEEIATELGLFKTYDEALHWAEDLKGSSERELVQKKSELLLQKAETELVQIERKDVYEQRAVERKDIYDERGSGRKDYYEQNGYLRKDYYDAVGTHRKDTSDELKWILGITATLLGAVALFRK